VLVTLVRLLHILGAHIDNKGYIWWNVGKVK
jgi:hypothetical protein